jgi:two-component system, sensor histidine kinase and response regulator
VCEQSVDLFALRAAEKGLLIYLHLDPALPRVVLGDAPRLRQVLANLLGNAVKFTEQGEVALRVMPAADVPGQVHLMVADTGVGVPQDQLEHVFGAFAQVDSTPRRRHGGTGLGLAICRELVQRMEGRIWLESVEGQGSTFHAVVQLAPAADESTLVPTAVDTAAPTEAARGPCLILEPEAGLSAALVDLATAAGHAEVSVVTELPRQAPAVAARLLCRAELLESRAVELPQGLHVVALMPVTGLAARLDRLRAMGVSAYVLMPPKLADLSHPARLDADGGRAMALHSTASCAETPAEACATTPIVPAADGDLTGAPRLLLVDDSVDNRQLVQAFLRGQPWQVDEACDGASAVAAAQALRYDLILMDIQMPGMDGYAAIQAIRASEGASGRLPSPIVALSAHTAQEDIDRAHASGCDAYLAKPLRKSALLECIARMQDTTGR